MCLVYTLKQQGLEVILLTGRKTSKEFVNIFTKEIIEGTQIFLFLYLGNLIVLSCNILNFFDQSELKIIVWETECLSTFLGFWLGFPAKCEDRFEKNRKKERIAFVREIVAYFVLFLSQNSASFSLPFAKFIFAKKNTKFCEKVREIIKNIFAKFPFFSQKFSFDGNPSFETRKK